MLLLREGAGGGDGGADANATFDAVAQPAALDAILNSSGWQRGVVEECEALVRPGRLALPLIASSFVAYNIIAIIMCLSILPLALTPGTGVNLFRSALAPLSRLAILATHTWARYCVFSAIFLFPLH